MSAGQSPRTGILSLPHTRQAWQAPSRAPHLDQGPVRGALWQVSRCWTTPALGCSLLGNLGQPLTPVCWGIPLVVLRLCVQLSSHRPPARTGVNTLWAWACDVPASRSLASASTCAPRPSRCRLPPPPPAPSAAGAAPCGPPASCCGGRAGLPQPGGYPQQQQARAAWQAWAAPGAAGGAVQAQLVGGQVVAVGGGQAAEGPGAWLQGPGLCASCCRA